MTREIPPVAVLVSHHVADYDAWKKAFDKYQSDRAQASCLGHHINRGADDPNMVYVYCPATDVDKVKAFVDSVELRNTMNEAGVDGPPTISLMTPKSADFIPDQKLPGVIVSHNVEDYDAWRAAYDGLAGFRKQSGVIGDAVNQEVGRPDRVIVYHQANEMDSLRTLIDSNELKEAMQRGGVSGPPDIRFVQVVDSAEY